MLHLSCNNEHGLEKEGGFLDLNAVLWKISPPAVTFAGKYKYA